MKTTKKTRFTIDFVNHSIKGTKASFDAAGKGQGPVYEELLEKVNNHPDYKLETIVLEKHKKGPKVSYEGLTKEFIKDYVHYLMDPDIEKEMKLNIEFFNKTNGKVFPKLKKWFLEKIDAKNNPLDIKKAEDEINKKKMEDFEAEMSKRANASTEEAA